jgi:glutathione S-transferase
MAPQYKLTYFDLTGLGEPIRFLLSYGGLDFVDQRVTKEEWVALKSKTPVGQMPLLEVDGKVLYQSLAIVRYLANVVGLVGKTPLENWEIDAAADTVNDLRVKVATWFFESNESIKATLQESLEKEHLPFYLSKLESWAKQNKGHLAIGKLTWADLFFVSIIDFLSFLLQRDPISS